jgi:hypothetical protein
MAPVTSALNSLLLEIAAAASAAMIVALKPLFARYAMVRPNARSSHTLGRRRLAHIASARYSLSVKLMTQRPTGAYPVVAARPIRR